MMRDDENQTNCTWVKIKMEAENHHVRVALPQEIRNHF